jgi:hypothetical protein
MCQKINILVLLAIVVSFSCKDKKEFKISSASVNFDSCMLIYNSKNDSIYNIIKQEIDASKDSTKPTGFLNLPSREMLTRLNKYDILLFKEYFSDINKPYIIKNIENEVVHFTIFNNNKIIELEVFNRELQFSKNIDTIQSIAINPELLQKVSTNCRCNQNEDLNNPFSNQIIRQNNKPYYRMDITSENDYKYCWKFLEEDDVLHQLLNEIEK